MVTINEGGLGGGGKEGHYPNWLPLFCYLVFSCQTYKPQNRNEYQEIYIRANYCVQFG